MSFSRWLPRVIAILILSYEPISFGGASGNGASFVSQLVPPAIGIGEKVTVKVTMRNTGTTTWSDAPSKGYLLGAQNPPENERWGLNRVRIEGDKKIAPGETYEFNFTITGPQAMGTPEFQWQMVQDYVEWFGEPTPPMKIMVMGRRWVHRLFEELIGREPNEQEIGVFRNTFAQGIPASDIAWRFLNSAQYFRAAVQKTFRLLYARDPNPAEYEKWIPAAQQGGLAAVISAVATSNEYFIHCDSSKRKTLFALYRDLLKETAATNFEESVKELEGGRSLAYAVNEILTSDTFLTQLSLNWAALHFKKSVTNLGEISPWLIRLQSGERWEKVLSDILGSAEYRMLHHYDHRSLASEVPDA